MLFIIMSSTIGVLPTEIYFKQIFLNNHERWTLCPPAYSRRIVSVRTMQMKTASESNSSTEASKLNRYKSSLSLLVLKVAFIFLSELFYN